VISWDQLVDTLPAWCITDADRGAHPAFVATLDDKPVWLAIWLAIWNESFRDAQNRHQRRLAAERA
jgi:hypothetical protein